jgi:hypothetical protein
VKFKYTQSLATDSKGHFLSRPLLEVELRGPQRTVTVLGLLDSGADMSLMNIRYAQALGIALDKLPTKDFVGISDARVPTYFTEVPIMVKHFSDVLYLPVAFADSPSVDVLLGQEEFFDAFRIRFEKDRDVFELQASRAYWSRELPGAPPNWSGDRTNYVRHLRAEATGAAQRAAEAASGGAETAG